MKWVVVALVLFALRNQRAVKQILSTWPYTHHGYRQMVHLANEHGKTYSVTHHIVLGILMSVLIVGCAVLFQLERQNCLFLLLIVSLLYPQVLIFLLQRQAYQRHFKELTLFLQYFIAFYKVHPHPQHVLQECLPLCSGALHERIKTMIERCFQGVPQREIFGLLLEYESHFIVHNLVRFVSDLETHGATHYLHTLDAMQEDIEQWIRDTYQFKEQQQRLMQRILLLVAMSLVIAFVAQGMLGQVDFNVHSPLYQGGMLLFLMSVLWTAYMAFKMLEEPWIDPAEQL